MRIGSVLLNSAAFTYLFRSRYYHAKSVVYKALAFAIGWGFVESICTYLLPFWFNARKPEFTWIYIVDGIGGELDFLETIIFSLIIFLNFGAGGKILKNTNIVNPILFIIYILLPFINEFIYTFCEDNLWLKLLSRGIVLITFGGIVSIAFRNTLKFGKKD